MKNRIIVIGGLILAIIVLIFLNFRSVNVDKINVRQIDPTEGSEVLASNKGYSIDVRFDNNITKIIDLIRIGDNFGLEWEKQIKDSNLINFSTSFGNEIMSIKELKIELYYGEELLKSWFYKVPLDKKITGLIVEPVLDEEASFIPSAEDITYFAQQQEIVNQEQPLWKLLPFETENFKISHYINALKLVVYLKGDAKQELVEPIVKNWIKENGGNIEQHKIEWREE